MIYSKTTHLEYFYVHFDVWCMPRNVHRDFRQVQNLVNTITTQSGLRLRRAKLFKRQNRVLDDHEVRKQLSEPTPTSTIPVLQRHGSYPQHTAIKNRLRVQERKVDTQYMRRADRKPSTTTSTSTSFETPASDATVHARASHTPAVRDGPPLSCNFCWNTVDECGRILRRKTQYHCPECRTNLCIVPCFHEYHDLPEAVASVSAR